MTPKIDLQEVLRQFAMMSEPFGDPNEAIRQYHAADKAIGELMDIQRRLVAWNRNVNGTGHELGDICAVAESILETLT